MSVLAKGTNIDSKDGIYVAHKMAAVKIYQGALVNINAAGFVDNCADGMTGAFFAGVAVETVDNSAGAAGDKYIRVQKVGIVKLPCSGMAQADVGTPVLASDNNTVTKTSAAGRAVVGPIVEFESATAVWVKLQTEVAVATS